MLECSVVAVHELGLHTQFVGEIKDVKVDAAGRWATTGGSTSIVSGPSSLLRRK